MRLEGIQVEKIAEISDTEAIDLVSVSGSKTVRLRRVESNELFDIGPRGGITQLTKAAPKKDEPKDDAPAEDSDWKPLSER